MYGGYIVVNIERQVLRKLAYEYLTISNNQRNAENAKLYRAVNDLHQIRPVVLIGEIPFHELNYDGSLTLKCTDKRLREVERYMRTTIFQWKHFPADMIVPPYIPIKKIIHSTGIGVEVEENILRKNTAGISSHEYIDQFSTDADLDKLTPPLITYDKEATMSNYDYISEMIGDIIPLKLCGIDSSAFTWDDISRLRGVENLLIDLIDRPKFTHNLVEKLTEFKISQHKQYEQLGLFEVNPYLIHRTAALTDDLPSKDFDGDHVTMKDLWGRGAAQILSSVSKEMLDEFDIPYMKRIFEPFGLVYYGCCEPLDKKIDVVEKLPHLRKISITPWADIDNASEIIGKKYVIANKPNPASVAVPHLDEDGLRKEIGRTLNAVYRNSCSCDIVLKDISSCAGNVQNLIRWEQITMDMVKHM